MRVIRKLGKGGFGIVEEVQLSDGRTVARKTFQPLGLNITRSSMDKLRHRFAREISAQMSLPPGIAIPILDFSLEGDRPWFTMPLAELTLAEQLKRDRGRGAMVDILFEVLQAIKRLHQNDRVHRDLTPSNIFKLNGSWLLGDLGLITPADGDAEITSSISAWGHKLYAAPELDQAFGMATARADIYAFGCILHDVFVGSTRIPFATHDGPGPIGAVIRNCTARQPRDRFQAADDVESALKTALGVSEADDHERAQQLLELLESEESHADQCCRSLRDLLARRHDLEDSMRSRLMRAISPEVLAGLAELDPPAAQRVSSMYMDWVKKLNNINFDDCDVIAERLQAIYELGPESQKIEAVLEAADLATAYNRWPTMGMVLSMASPEVSDDFAAALAVELQKRKRYSSFWECAARLEEEPSIYHPTIAKRLRRWRKDRIGAP